MKTYFRILNFVKPYWKHLSLSVIFTILFALLNGLSVYLTIPLLDTLFQESIRKGTVEQTSTLEKAGSEIVRNLKFSEETLKALEEPLIPYDVYLRQATRHWDAFLRNKK